MVTHVGRNEFLEDQPRFPTQWGEVPALPNLLRLETPTYVRPRVTKVGSLTHKEVGM